MHFIALAEIGLSTFFSPPLIPQVITEATGTAVTQNHQRGKHCRYFSIHSQYDAFVWYGFVYELFFICLT